MSERQEYLVRFLMGCADAADRDELGVMQQRLLVNGDLMQEAAEEFEKLVTKKELSSDLPSKGGPFESFSDELEFNLRRAEQYARRAHDMLYTRPGYVRSLWFKMAVGRAQSILMNLANQELGRKKAI